MSRRRGEKFSAYSATENKVREYMPSRYLPVAMSRSFVRSELDLRATPLLRAIEQ